MGTGQAGDLSDALGASNFRGIAVKDRLSRPEQAPKCGTPPDSLQRVPGAVSYGILSNTPVIVSNFCQYTQRCLKTWVSCVFR